MHKKVAHFDLPQGNRSNVETRIPKGTPADNSTTRCLSTTVPLARTLGKEGYASTQSVLPGPRVLELNTQTRSVSPQRLGNPVKALETQEPRTKKERGAE